MKKSILKSIVFRVNISIIITISIISLAMTFYEYTTFKNEAFKELLKNSDSKIERLKNSIILPFWNLELEQASIILKMEMDVESVNGITVRQTDGKVFLSKIKNKNGEVIDGEPGKEKYYKTITKKIIKDDKEIGEVQMNLNDNEIRHQLRFRLIKGFVENLFQIIIISLIIFLLIKKIVNSPLEKFGNKIKDIARGDGDLTKRIEISTNDEIGELTAEFNTFLDKLHKIIKTVDEKVSGVRLPSDEIASSLNILASSSEEVLSQSNTVAAATEEIATSISQISENSKKVSNLVETISSSINEMSSSFNEVALNCQNELAIANDANNQAKSTYEMINNLMSSAKEVSKVIDIIDDISDQINLLALNASIESASAGEAGKGFAVVANEIKVLAKQTSNATLEIEKQITNMQEITEGSVKKISGISEIIGDVNNISQTIASAVEEQSVIAKEIANTISNASVSVSEIAHNSNQAAPTLIEISSNIQNVNLAVKDTVKNILNISNNASLMKDNTEDLNKIVLQFKI